MGDKWETSVNSCGPRHPEWEKGGDKGETSVNPWGPRNPEWETSVGDKWATSGRHVGDTCKLMRPKAPRVGDKEETSVNSCGQSGRQVSETSGRQV